MLACYLGDDKKDAKCCLLQSPFVVVVSFICPLPLFLCVLYCVVFVLFTSREKIMLTQTVSLALAGL